MIKWDIGTDISSRDGSMNNLDVSLNVSTHLLDNRLRIKTNFGYKSSSDISTTQSFVGNDTEYILNRFFKLRMYTKENDKYYLVLTTQGLGVVYTKEVSDSKTLLDS